LHWSVESTVHIGKMLKKTHDKPGRGSDPSPNNRARRGLIRSVGLGAVTGAADDDCSAIGTYASAGAQFGTSLLWTAPITFPMMCAVVYLSSKLGQVTGRGLFHVVKDHYPRWILWPALIGS
jgi:Mn2+/Fe2+ NRAMP family transporter